MQKRISKAVFLFGLLSQCTDALVSPQSSTGRRSGSSTSLNAQKIPKAVASSMLATSLMISSLQPVQAYDASDYASETVKEAVQSLKDASGNVDATFKVYENIAGIITEGKGVGGMVNYKGVQLERGYVADEDTSIYNPGLTLLTESEKERLVEAVIDSRKAGLKAGQWSENNEFAYEFLKGRLDPLHMAELSGFLGFVPFYGGILYLAVLAVQQNLRGLFTPAYIVGVVAFFGPILALIAAGP
mmetsp:Transcript_106061/g.306775  ORF Transcript_106061/g.306775 Transcript_106061/m.306775 type:complete len:244 (-) Transcript_106061:129-860(-)|eukprot:CAMPEP_0176025762 /NCGR_PEP_ID=MMETSP0120_2-20121206/12609_1 /TAXON_ID=160619 /ORGANISM="Kryptoperidinium foliaceum, Strain CCMP 1326" /LENGTH=243 /DNA_ID=CAMNT_0017358951 /DNA_START=120 /DNA_END=851 /DNA_ORIENTATION=-